MNRVGVIRNCLDPLALTPRELQVAGLACKYRNKAIAQTLGISAITVKNHLHEAYEKLRIAGRPELPAALEKLNAESRRQTSSTSSVSFGGKEFPKSGRYLR